MRDSVSNDKHHMPRPDAVLGMPRINTNDAIRLFATSTACNQANSKNYLKHKIENVRSVEVINLAVETGTSTMTTRQGCFAGFFVSHATPLSARLETLSKVSNEHSTISRRAKSDDIENKRWAA